MSSSTICFCSRWDLVKKGNLVNSTRDDRRLIRPSVSCLIGIFQVPGWASRKLLTVIIIGISTSPQTIFVISRWFPVVECCQMHLRLSSYVMDFLLENFVYTLYVFWRRVEVKAFNQRIVLWLFGALAVIFFPITNSFWQYCKYFSFWIIS